MYTIMPFRTLRRSGLSHEDAYNAPGGCRSLSDRSATASIAANKADLVAALSGSLDRDPARELFELLPKGASRA